LPAVFDFYVDNCLGLRVVTMLGFFFAA